MQPVDQFPGTIVHLISGAGDRYCGSCLFASTLVKALQAAGCRSVVYPLYTPVHSDIRLAPDGPLFFGGVNVYLQQRFALFRKTPRWLDAWFDRPRLLLRLGGASAEGSKTTGDILLSMLAGEEGCQRKELHRLLRALEANEVPAIVHLSNALLLGIAEGVRRRLGTPVVCSLTGEDGFLATLPGAIAERARRRMTQLVEHVDAFVAVCPSYAERMAAFLDVPTEKVHVVPPAIMVPDDLAGYEDHGTSQDRPVRIGFLGNVTPEKGVDLAVEAFCHAASRLPDRRFELAIAGRLDRAYRRFWKGLMRHWRAGRSVGRIVYHGELTPSQKWAFLRSLDLMVLPSRYAESKGMVMLEAAMVGVPSLVPHRGAFRDWIEALGVGWSYTEDTPSKIGDRLAEIVSDREALVRSQREVCDSARRTFTLERLGRDMRLVYEKVTARGG